MSEAVLTVNNLSKKFCLSLKRSLMYGVQDIAKEILLTKGSSQTQLRQDEFWALKDISFKLHRGETLSLVGHNGAGKTTLLKLINGLIKPDIGVIDVCGTIGALIAVGPGFNPILTGRENIYVSGSILGLSKREIDLRFEEIVDFAEIGEFIDAPVKSYSSGMLSRLGFAVASTLTPDILLIDEVLSVGDSSFRQRCITRLNEYKRNGGSIIFVSHNSVAVEAVSDRVIWLERGKVVEIGKPFGIIQKYETKALQLSLKAQKSLNPTQDVSQDKIKIIAVDCCNVLDIPQNDFDFCESFKIQVSYEITADIPHPHCVIALGKNDQSHDYLCMMTSFWQQNTIKITDQKGMFECLVNHPNLSPGNYHIYLGFMSHYSGELGEKWVMPMKKIQSITILSQAISKIFSTAPASHLVTGIPPIVLNHSWSWNSQKVSLENR